MAAHGIVGNRMQYLSSAVRSLYGYALQLAGNHDDAEDLLQDVLLKVTVLEHGFRPDASVRSWLRAAIRNHFLDGVRRRSLEEKYPSLLLPPDASGLSSPHLPDPGELAEQELIRGDLGRHLDVALGKLTGLQLELVALHYVDDLSVAEIARMQGLSPGTVCSRLARARSRLRAVLVQEGFSPEMTYDDTWAGGNAPVPEKV